MGQLVRWIARVLILAIGLPAGVANAQASPSPYTSATRYDAMGRVVGTIAPEEGIFSYPDSYLATRTTYDPAGRPIKVETGELSSWQSELVSVVPTCQAPVQCWGSAFTTFTTIETTYDTLSRKLQERVRGSDNALVSLTEYKYDTAGRLECTAIRMNPAHFGSAWQNACTHRTAGSYGQDRITKTTYDAAGQVLQVRVGVGTAVEAADVTYTYTANGKQEYVTDANGNKARLVYDGFDRQIAWIFPSKTTAGSLASCNLGSVTEVSDINGVYSGPSGTYQAGNDCEKYFYDRNGNRAKLAKRDGQEIRYTYDALNRMTKKDVPGTTARDVYYGYDLRGLQTYARFDGPETTREGITSVYDGFGRRTTETQKMDGATRTISATLFDRNGNRVSMTHPDGQVLIYNYDQLNRNYRISNPTGTGTMVFPHYNNAGRQDYIARWNPSSANWLAATGFTYDNAGRRLSASNTFDGGTYNIYTYAYNPANQLTSEARSDDSYAFTGHANVNRNYTSNGLNQYTVAGPASFTYDANGNLTSDGANTFTYDAENRLISRSGGGSSATLRYDPMGRLYEVNGSATGITRFLNDGDALVAEYSGSGALLRRYVHGVDASDDPQVWFEGSTVADSARRYLYADRRGSIIAVTNATGGVLHKNSYDEYGIPGANNQGRFQYTGQAWIPELGMYYYKARMYSPTLGRFMQTDPIGYEDQFNLYAYVGNDPVNGSDPSGMYECVKGDCDIASAAYNDAVGALKNLDANSNEAVVLKSTLDHMGAPAEVGRDGPVLVSIDAELPTQFDDRTGINLNPDQHNTAAGRASAFAHEGSHSERKATEGPLSSGAERMADETRAYTVGNGVDIGLTGSPGNPDVSAAALRSFNAACASDPGHASCN